MNKELCIRFAVAVPAMVIFGYTVGMLTQGTPLELPGLFATCFMGAWLGWIVVS